MQLLIWANKTVTARDGDFDGTEQSSLFHNHLLACLGKVHFHEIFKEFIYSALLLLMRSDIAAR